MKKSIANILFKIMSNIHVYIMLCLSSRDALGLYCAKFCCCTVWLRKDNYVIEVSVLTLYIVTCSRSGKWEQ